jgi:alpha-L-fucosidase 2
MVYGGIVEDRIQVNLDTLFTARPHDYAPDAVKSLPEIRRLLFEGRQEDAEALAMQTFMSVSSDGDIRQESYQPFVELLLKVPGEGEAGDYRRDLDLETAVARVGYRRNGKPQDTSTTQRKSSPSISSDSAHGHSPNRSHRSLGETVSPR